MSRPAPAVAAADAGRDLLTIYAIQALRALLYGFASVLLGTSLAQAGYSDAQVGLVFSAMLAGFALTSIVVGTRGDRIGRRRLYGALFFMMGAAGTVFALTRWLPGLLIAALTGTVSVEANESGPITSLEQAMIPQLAAGSRGRNRAFARYNAVAYFAGSLGALAAGGPDFFRRFFPALPASQRFLLAFPAVGIGCALLAFRLSSNVEAPVRTARHLPPLKAKGRIAGLGGLFALDAFGGGFVVTSFLVFWFQRKFGVSTEIMGLVFFFAGLLQCGSSIAAGWLASRIGLLNTMVFTHLPSNLLLILIPFVPSLGPAIAMLLARFAISQMDVPARQAYVVAVVEPDDRTAAAAYTNAARQVFRPAGPALGGYLMQGVSLAAPFVVAGSLKILYDLILFGAFRRISLPDGSANG